ncbi:MAG: energy transducer TonB [Saprospiraceae bacterium]
MIRKLPIIITILLQAIFGMAQPDESIRTIAEQMPYFMGCTDLENGTAKKRNCSNQNLIEFISRNIQYPQAALDQGIEGTVLINFIINAAGEMESTEVLRDIGGDCGKEALRIMELMPDWEPALDSGEPVAVRLNLPVTFSLQNAENQLASKYQIQWGTLREKQITKEELKRHISKKVFIRDEFGEEVDITNLTFVYQKKRAFHEATSTGRINKRMEKVIKKVKKGGSFFVIATIQKKGEIFEIEREYLVVE